MVGSMRLAGSIVSDSQVSETWQLPPSRSDDLHLHFVNSGTVSVRSPGADKTLDLTRGDALLSTNGDELEVSCTRKHGEPPCHLLRGQIRFDGGHRHPLVSTLPALVRASIADAGRQTWAMVEILLDELRQSKSGSSVIVDRVCELLLVHVFRSLAQDQHTPAVDDPIIARALRLMHDRPEQDWTLASLARTIGMSRSAFATRFNDVVGVPPKCYLTQCRMHKAQRLLRQRNANVSSIAPRVGYASDATFIRAFKRYCGESPGVFHNAAMRKEAVGT
ncbi:MAG: AraC family transcriptional regulator [Pseudomonadota bacterium]